MEKDCRDGSVNIYDIARMANVSIATVSRVMNHSGKVSEKTRKKVEKIMVILKRSWQRRGITVS